MIPINLFGVIALTDGLTIQEFLRSRGFGVSFVFVVAILTIIWFRRRDRNKLGAVDQPKVQAESLEPERERS